MLLSMEEAAVAAADELGLLDFVSDENPSRKPLNRTNPSHKNPNSLLFDELLDGAISGLSPPVKNSPPSDVDDDVDEEEEEELEWISNKDAFPSLETSFSITTTTSPVSVLVPAPSFKVPVKARSKMSRKRRRIFPPMEAAAPVVAVKGGRRRCRHCEVEETPQWRMGPEGPKTLCNACGVRYKKGRLYPEYRPANSPTFAAGVHSNSTRRIMEMRMGRGRGGGAGGKRGRPRLVVL